MFELSNYKDIDAGISSLVTRYYSLMDSGNYEDAYELLSANETLLKPYFINADSFNKIELGIWEIAQMVNYSQKIVLSDTEPNSSKYQLAINSEWLQEY